MRAGIPQVIQPLAFDQFDNAARTVTLGIGSIIPKKSFRSPVLATTLKTVLANPATWEQCRDTAHQMQTGQGLAVASDIIERHFIRTIS